MAKLVGPWPECGRFIEDKCGSVLGDGISLPYSHNMPSEHDALGFKFQLFLFQLVEDLAGAGSRAGDRELKVSGAGHGAKVLDDVSDVTARHSDHGGVDYLGGSIGGSGDGAQHPVLPRIHDGEIYLALPSFSEQVAEDRELRVAELGA